MAVVEMAVVGAGGTMATEAKAVMVAAGMAVVEMAVVGAGGTMATEPKAVMAAAGMAVVEMAVAGAGGMRVLAAAVQARVDEARVEPLEVSAMEVEARAEATAMEYPAARWQRWAVLARLLLGALLAELKGPLSIGADHARKPREGAHNGKEGD